MTKFLLFLAIIAGVSFMAFQNIWPIHVTAFGYQISFSGVLLIAAFALLLYLLHLLKKPFHWAHQYQHWCSARQQDKRACFTTLLLKTLVDGDEENRRLLLKQRSTFFEPKSDAYLLVTALLEPSRHTFEQLLHRPSTELAGVRGLLDEAQKIGDWEEANRLLVRAARTHADTDWVLKALWTNEVMQNDWNDSLKTLDSLLKKRLISHQEYTSWKACVLLKLGRAKEAFKLAPENPATGLAYAQATPEKAKDILIKSWRLTPCWETYEAYKTLISTQPQTKQVKLVEKLISKNPTHHLSLLALADTARMASLWGMAKEHLEIYMKTYPLSKQAALMMAEVERSGWHHEPSAKVWEQKAETATTTDGWICAKCEHITESWDAKCPMCNSFGSLGYK